MNPARFYTYRFFITFNVVLYAAAFAIMIWKRFRVNYPYILETGNISPYTMLIYAQQVTVGMLACKYIHLAFWNSVVMVRVFLLTAFVIFIWCFPIRKLHNMRFEYMRMNVHYLIGPFGEVQYRNIIMASIYNTLRVSMVDGSWMVCLYTSGAVINGTSPTCSAWLP